MPAPNQKTPNTAIVWFRQDLRLSDNAALAQACKSADHVLAVFIDDPLPGSCSRIGSASRVWLHHSLASLDKSLQAKGNRLLMCTGDSEEILQQLVQQTSASDLFWNRCYDPVSIKRDKKIKKNLAAKLSVHSFNGLLVAEPWQNCKDDGTPYRVFTPYWRRLAPSLPGTAPLSAPRSIPSPPPLAEMAASDSSGVATISRQTPENMLAALQLLPEIAWHEQMMANWQVGESAARSRMRSWLKKEVNDYREMRNLPEHEGTSRLSPHLHFGEISSRQVLHALYKDNNEVNNAGSGAETFAKEIVWREFAYHLIYHFPTTISKPLDVRFSDFPWPRLNRRHLQAWQQGMTGVPIVDAGMRELWNTGWMHNRVRMIVASYLIKNLLIPWQKGEQWFRDTLVDADIASNVMGWQWTAGCGADAAPYFRIFNPVLQGEKFDPDGTYVRRWVPELVDVEKRFIHKPWELEPVLAAQIDYPEPLVDLKLSRQAALKAFDLIKNPTASGAGS